MPKKVLIVDDENDARLLWSAVATDSGLEVVEATDGREALDILRRDPAFDLVVLDVMMPFADGYEVVKQMREDAQLKTIPVIISTANRTTQELPTAALDGLTSYINKASGLENMRRGIAQALGMK